MTDVMFRVDKKTGDLLAMFPQEPADLHRALVEIYEPAVGHHAGSYTTIMLTTRPSRAGECEVLQAELERLGYDDLNLVTRRNRRAFYKRWCAIRKDHGL